MVEQRRFRVVQMLSAHRALDVRIFHKISKSLARHGYEVILVARHPRDETVDGIRIAAVPRAGGRLRRMTASLYQIYKKAVELNGDIYHIHEPELLGPGLLLKLCGKHVIYDAHEDLPRSVAYKEYVPRWLRSCVATATETLELYAARKMTAVIGATPPIADRLGKVNPRAVVVHNFPLHDELTRHAPASWEQRRPAVAYAGLISRERGIFELLEAINRLQPRMSCRLALAGWYSSTKLKEQVQRLPAARHVDYLGVLSPQGVAKMLARVRVGSVVLHPESNFLNSKATKMFEYMCAGIPVVASNFPIWRDIVEDASCGLLVDPLKPAEIAEAFAYLLGHPKEAEEMGRNGRAAAARLFNWESEERTLLSLYRSILKQKDVFTADVLESTSAE